MVLNRPKIIVLIGGSAGVGKTTLAKMLSEAFNIDHRIGTGYIREALRSVLTKQDYEYLHTSTFRPSRKNSLIDSYLRQCQAMSFALNSCMKRARKEGTSLIIEGSNILPAAIEMSQADLFLILKVTSKIKHLSLLLGDTHRFRQISKQDFMNIRKIQSYIIQEVKKADSQNLYVIENYKLEKVIQFVSDKCILSKIRREER